MSAPPHEPPKPAEEYELELRRPLVKIPFSELADEVLGHSPGAFPVGIFGLVSLFVLAALTLWDVTIIRDIRRGADKATVTSAMGKDDQGRGATYRIVLLSGEYFWKLGDTATVVNSEGTEVRLEEKLATSGVAGLLNRSTDLIAVGTASCVGGGPEEESRALDRARNLVAWLRQVPLEQSVEHIYLLNLGQYDEPCGYGPREIEQRMVIIIGVTEKQPGVDIEQSFWDALVTASKGPLRRLDLPAYTNWPRERFKLEPVM